MHKNKNQGFSLIEILVVISIIGLLASFVLIALNSARGKSRDSKRLSEAAQVHTALELFFSEHGGYPSGTAGQIASGGLIPNIITQIPTAPRPADGPCPSFFSLDGLNNPVPGNEYYYIPTGTSEISPTIGLVYPTYNFYFCLGGQTGSYSAGGRVLSPYGLR